MPGPIKQYDLERIRQYLTAPSADGSLTLKGYSDTIEVYKYQEVGRDGRNQPIKAWVLQGTIQPARIRPVTGSDEAMDLSQVPEATDILHLPFSTPVLPAGADRVKIIARWNRTLDPAQTFEIIGNVEQNSNEYTAVLKLVTNASQ